MPKPTAPKGDFYVFSTLTNDQIYRTYAKAGGGDINVPEIDVFIAGGANRPSDTTTRQGIYTPRGMVTPVSSDELDLLRANDLFLLHEKNGYVVVSQTMDDADDVAESEMEAADGSAPVTQERLDAEAEAAGTGPAPVVADSSRTADAPTPPKAPAAATPSARKA